LRERTPTKEKSGEVTAVSQYFLHASMCKNWGYIALYEKIYEESLEEMRHAQRLIDRILFLEGMLVLTHEACDGHVTYHLRDVILRASERCTLTWRLGVYDSAAVEVFTGWVPVRGSYGQPELALQRSRACALALSTVAGHQEEFARV
jgi:Ferritin-like domain